MIEAWLERILRLVLERPKRVLAAALLPALFSLQAFFVPVDLSFAGLMNRAHPEVARYFEMSQRYGLGGWLPTLIEGPEAALDAAVVALRERLESLPGVDSLQGDWPRAWLRAQSPWLVDRATFDLWLEIARDPQDVEKQADLAARLAAFEASAGGRRHAGTRLVLIQMAEDSFELALDADAFPRVRAAAEEVLSAYSASAAFSGMPAIITQEQEATLERMRLLGPVSLVLALILLGVVERRPIVLLGIALAMLLSLGVTLASIGWIEGRLTLMESVFGVLVFGLGVDFAIHLRLRWKEERQAGAGLETGLRRALLGTGRGIVAGALTTAGAFLIMAFAPDPVFRRLGLAGGIGLLLCLVFLVVLLPAQWVLLERRAVRRAGAGRAGQPLAARIDGRGARVPPLLWIEALATRSAGAPWYVLAIGALLLAVGAAGLTQFRYETDLERVFSRDIRAVEVARRIHVLYDLDPRPWLVTAADLEEARVLTTRFRAEATFRRVESLASLLPADLAERGRRLAEIAPALALGVSPAISPPVSPPISPGNAPGVGPAASDALRPLRSALRFGPPSEDTLPMGLRRRFIAADGRYLVYAFTEAPRMDSAVAARERIVARAIAPEATSMNVLFEALIGSDRPWLPPLIACVLLYIAAVLYLDLRRLPLVAMALLPVVASSILSVGLLSLFGVAFNTVTLVGVPLLLGLGVDDGIHVVHRLLERSQRTTGERVGAVGRSIAMTTATTCASVAALLFTHHPGIESVALLLLVGLPLCLLASVTLVPACAALTRSGGD